MSPTDPRAAMSCALQRMLDAHTALVADVNPATLRAFIDASNAARDAHEAMVQRALERAKKARAGR